MIAFEYSYDVFGPPNIHLIGAKFILFEDKFIDEFENPIYSIAHAEK